MGIEILETGQVEFIQNGIYDEDLQFKQTGVACRRDCILATTTTQRRLAFAFKPRFRLD